MKTPVSKMLLGAAVAGILAAAIPAQANSCYAKGQCSGMGHECAGQNACKGQGWLAIPKEACLAIEGGSLSPKKS